MIAEVDHKLQAHARVCKENKEKLLKKQLLVKNILWPKDQHSRAAEQEWDTQTS